MELILGLIAIVVFVASIVMWLWKKNRAYKQNIKDLPRRLRSLNINEIGCLQAEGIVNSDTELKIADLETLIKNHDDAILKDCLGAHIVIHEILDIDESIRKYRWFFPF